MAGLAEGRDPAIHVCRCVKKEVVGRNKHGSRRNEVPAAASGLVETARGHDDSGLSKRRRISAGVAPRYETERPLPAWIARTAAAIRPPTSGPAGPPEPPRRAARLSAIGPGA